MMTQPLLIVTVAAVGVLHTLVPDHWAPIVVLGRQQGWSVARTGRAAALAGLGHVTTTLLLGVVLWAVGAALAVRYAHLVSMGAAVALLAFGAWIAYGGWRELQADDAGHGHSHMAHAHGHRHEEGTQHVHWHEHHEADWHVAQPGLAVMHEHEHAVAGRTALLLILGSSPMVEGIPAFFAASPYGVPLLASMAAVFAASTIATYVGVSVAGIAGLQRVSLGPLERYGEVASGLFVALVGVYALVTA
jgi:ABC-type nickel/cobalt efflux system permease component RcnA